MSHIDVALETAEFAPVFPCLPSKRPATKHGFHDATTDPKRITAWWTRHPDHLVAIPTEGLLVVDLDDRPGKPPAWHTWVELAEPHGWSVTDDHGKPLVRMVATPSGGVHIYHRLPKGTEVRNSASKLGPGIDVRANGGYVIAAGSRLPDGREYEQLCPFADPIPEAPAWLIEAASSAPAPELPERRPAYGGTRYGVQALEAELGRLALATEGTRNETLVRAAFRAGQLAGGGELDAYHAHDQLLAVAIRIGLPQSEAEHTIRSGMRSGAQQPRQAPS
ncbi:MAG TPA: bifunctional DNA primase/polymerase [Micromonosporaceae bacterium]|nr:bifunctional DNA primase/polymerase [Micromonosporaceae bacterium]